MEKFGSFGSSVGRTAGKMIKTTTSAVQGAGKVAGKTLSNALNSVLKPGQKIPLGNGMDYVGPLSKSAAKSAPVGTVTKSAAGKSAKSGKVFVKGADEMMEMPTDTLSKKAVVPKASSLKNAQEGDLALTVGGKGPGKGKIFRFSKAKGWEIAKQTVIWGSVIGLGAWLLTDDDAGEKLGTPVAGIFDKIKDFFGTALEPLKLPSFYSSLAICSSLIVAIAVFFIQKTKK